MTTEGTCCMYRGDPRFNLSIIPFVNTHLVRVINSERSIAMIDRRRVIGQVSRAERGGATCDCNARNHKRGMRDRLRIAEQSGKCEKLLEIYRETESPVRVT